MSGQMVFMEQGDSVGPEHEPPNTSSWVSALTMPPAGGENMNKSHLLHLCHGNYDRHVVMTVP